MGTLVGRAGHHSGSGGGGVTVVTGVGVGSGGGGGGVGAGHPERVRRAKIAQTIIVEFKNLFIFFPFIF
jgi:hypothetical protein